MTPCRSCGRKVRSTRIALVLIPGRGIKGGRVCRDCEKDGVLVVAPKLAPRIDTAKAERREQQDVLAPFVSLIKARLELRRRTAPMPDADAETRAAYEGGNEQLDNVLAMLTEGRT